MQKAFALIELMVIVAILSVVAAIAVPRFLRHQTLTRQEECHRNLASLLAAEKGYFQKKGEYVAETETLRWQPVGRPWHTYRFLPSSSPKTTFLFGCIGNIDRDPTLDEATIDETGKIQQLSDDVKK